MSVAVLERHLESDPLGRALSPFQTFPQNILQHHDQPIWNEGRLFTYLQNYGIFH
jgi:hypothetical protein